MQIFPRAGKLSRLFLLSSISCRNFLEQSSLCAVAKHPVHPQIALKSSTMASTDALERIRARAEETERVLSHLQSQVDAIRKAAVKQASLDEEKKLERENDCLKKEIETLKMALVLAEVGNGVRQIHVPSKCVAASRSDAAPSSNKVAGTGPASKPKEKPQKASDKATDKKTAPPESKKAKTDAKEKKGKEESAGGKGKNAAGGGGDGDKDLPVDISRLEMRVGKIVAVEKHPDADSLYVEQVDLGEGKIRTIVSGLVKHVPINAMKDRVAVFMCNLKPAKMRGVMSEGMIMCASSPEKVEILVPPVSAVIGDRVVVKEFPGEPDAMLNPKKKVWETLKPDVRTNTERVATYKGAVFTIEGKGVVMAPTLADTQIS